MKTPLNGVVVNFCETCDHIPSEGWHHLIKVVPVSNSINDSLHIIRLVWIMWYYVIQDLS